MYRPSWIRCYMKIGWFFNLGPHPTNYADALCTTYYTLFNPNLNGSSPQALGLLILLPLLRRDCRGHCHQLFPRSSLLNSWSLGGDVSVVMINKIVNKFVSQPVWSPWVAFSPFSADSIHSLDLLLQIHPLLLLLLHPFADHLCQPLCFHPFCQTCPSSPSSCPSLAQVAQHCHSCLVPLHHQRIPLVLVQQSCHSRSSCRWRKIRWCFGDLRRVLNANALLWKCAKLQIVNLYWGTTSCPSVLLKPSLSVGKPRLGPGPWTPISGSSARFDGLLDLICDNMIMLNDNL